MKILGTLSACLVSLTFLNVQISHSQSTGDDLLSTINVYDIYEFNDTLWENLKKSQLLTHMSSYDVSVQSIQTHQDLLEALRKYVDRDQLRENLTLLEMDLIEIDKLYNKMIFYRRDGKSMDLKDSMLEECNKTLAHGKGTELGSLRYTLNLLFTAHTQIFEGMKGQLEAYSKTCSTEDSQQSVQSLFHSYFTLLISAKLKIFTSLNIAFDTLKEDEFSDFYSASTMYTHRINYLNTELKKIAGVFRTIMTDASRNVWKCNPETHVEDKTYIKLKNLFNAYLRAPKDIRQREAFSTYFGMVFQSNVYDDKCGDSTLITYETRKELCPNNRKCPGTLYDCEKKMKIDGDSSISVCFSNDQSDRTYDYVVKDVSNTAVHQGLFQKCSGSEVKIQKDVFNFDLNYCVCDMDKVKEKVSDRKFYIGAVMADVSDNYVITGARLRKNQKHGIVYIEIEQGKLLPGGNIDNSSRSWKTVSEDELLDTSKHHNVNWISRDIEIADLDVPHGNVLVGVRFRKVHYYLVGLEAFYRPFDLTLGVLGKLQASVSNKQGFDVDHLNTPEIKLPDFSRRYTYAESSRNLRFLISSFDNDVGQTTIPFIDIQDVASKKSYPMSGVGLYYRTIWDDDYAGFIALKLKTYDYSKLIPLIQ